MGERQYFDASVLAIDCSVASRPIEEIASCYDTVRKEFGNELGKVLEASFASYWSMKTKPGSARESFGQPLEVLVARSVLLTRFGVRALDYDDAYPVMSEGDTVVWANEDTCKAWRSVVPKGMLIYKPESSPFIDPSNPLCSSYWLLARETLAYEPLLMMLTEYRPVVLKDRILPPFSRRRRLFGQIKGFVKRFYSKLIHDSGISNFEKRSPVDLINRLSL